MIHDAVVKDIAILQKNGYLAGRAFQVNNWSDKGFTVLIVTIFASPEVNLPIAQLKTSYVNNGSKF